ncbi:MAG: hypothetical protein ACTHKE_08140 [Sphingomicrobium sp.]|jgi:hypothetical protein
MTHLRSGVAVLLFVAAPASAQSLANGDPLQFYHEYHCNNERMVVGECRDNNPASQCSVTYPDRKPAHPGYLVTVSETLGDVLKKLSACSASASAINSPRRRAQVASSASADSVEATDDRAIRAKAASDGVAYLSCVTDDPAWRPPLTIMIDEPRNEVRVSGAAASGTSSNPQFNPETVVFGFAGRVFTVNRVNLSLTTEDTSFFGQTYRGVCKFGAPPKRAF